jgi:GAF domain
MSSGGPDRAAAAADSTKDGTRAMDHHSTLDQSSVPPAMEGDMPGTSASQSGTASVSAGIAAANAHLPKSPETGSRFPGEDGGRSLAEMANSDLDAALQLLAERAQYITGASGAAIALRRGEHNDMLCRASAGSNAPELGALLSTEYGLSGESVRTRQVLLCDDAERDLRVNREACRQLGIASVVVMPIEADEQVLGVFELLSGKPRAFDERDLSALRRLSEMVETAVGHAVAAQTMPAAPQLVSEEPRPSVPVIAAQTPRVDAPGNVTGPDFVPVPPEKCLPTQEAEKTELETTAGPAPKKPLFWSAAMQTPSDAARAHEAADSIAVPPVLRSLQKCQACGFPVSQGRTFCVECEEKHWRGQRLPRPNAGIAQQAQPETQVHRTTEDAQRILVLKDSSSAQTSVQPKESSSGERAIPPSAVAGMPQNLTSAPIASVTTAAQIPVSSSSEVKDISANLPQQAMQNGVADVPGSNNSVPFLSSAVESESWFAANKYILGALLVVAIIIGAIAWLR